MAQNSIPYNPTATVEPTSGGSGATYGSVPEASPAAFGAQIGQAEEKFGATSEDLGKMYMQRANEASANDKIVNQWAPTVTKLSQDYYSKQGKDAVAGFQPYMQGLQEARAKMLQDATPAEAQILNQYMTRHVAQEYDGAMRHQVQQMDVYENQMSDAFVGQQTTNAVNAGSNPDMINTAIQSGTGRIQVHGLDRGQSPEMIKQQQDDFVGKTAQAVVSSAITRGDLPFANSFYANNKDNISGAEQVNIDKVLHGENMRTFGNDAANAIINGNPIPHGPNSNVDTTGVKSTVAGAAQTAGVDPNASLMIAGIESSFGQNVGTRGDVGQTGKPAANLNEQANNLVTAQKQAQDAADKAVGGTAQPWQMYTVYQQGIGGGVALLKPENANAKAVDVLSPFYSNPKDALAAIQKNGGNATMTSAQFTDMLKQKCDTIYGQVKCDTATPNGQPIDLSKAITDPHQTGGTTLQPAATPVQALRAFDAQYPQMLQRAQEIPNLDQRSATLEALEKKHSLYQGAANAYTSVLTSQASQLMADPKFSMDQVTPEMYTALATDHPQTLIAMQNRSKEVAEGNPLGKDLKNYGPGFKDAASDVLSGKIKDEKPLQEAYNNNQINFEGYKELVGKLPKNAKDPIQQENLNRMNKDTFDVIDNMITHGAPKAMIDMSPALKDSVAAAHVAMFNAIKERESRQIPPSQYYDKENKEWIGNDAKVFQLTKAQALQGQIQAGKAAVKPRTLGDILGEAIASKSNPAKQAQLRQEAIDAGYFDPNAPAVPMAGQ